MTTEAEYLARVPQGVGYFFGEYRPLADMRLSISDLGYTQGAAAYDVGSVVDGHFFRLNEHLSRFRASAKGLYLPVQISDDEITDILRQCVIRSGFEDRAFVWMGVSQGIPKSGNPRDYNGAEPWFYAYAKKYYGLPLSESANSGVNLSVSDVMRIPSKSVNPKFKNHHWLDLRIAEIEAQQAGFTDTVLLDESNHVSEGPGYNICGVRNGEVFTPEDNSLEGITIGALRDISNEVDIPFVTRDVLADELQDADEVFLTSTSGGITPVLTIDGKQLPDERPITTKLTDEYWKKHSDPSWTTPVRV